MDTLESLLSQINTEKDASGQASDAELLRNLVQQQMTRGLSVGPTQANAEGGPMYSGPVAGYAGPTRASDVPDINAAADIPVYNGAQLSPGTIQARADAGGPFRGTMPAADAQRLSQGIQGFEATAPRSAVEVTKGILEKLGLHENAYNKAFQSQSGKMAAENAAFGGGGNLDGMAKLLAERKLDPTMITRLPAAQKAALINKGLQIDPGLDMKEYKQQADTIKDFSSGPSSKNIDRLNTAVDHLEKLKTTGDKLQNSGVRAYNYFKNSLSKNLGEPEVKAYMDAAHAVAGEMAAVFKNGTGTDVEIKKWLDNISSSDSPAQIQTNFDTLVALMQGRVGALESRYEKIVHKSPEIFSAKARGIIQRLGSVDLGGNSKQPPATQASAPQGAIDALKARPELKDDFQRKYGFLPPGV